MIKTRIFGLTGGIGSGKSAAAKHFESLGIATIDADILAREVVAPGSKALSEIAAHFGHQVVTPEGALNRKLLRDLVFNSDEERHWLEALLHPLIRKLTLERLSAMKSAYGLLVSPLLYESGQDALVEKSIVVDVPETTQLARSMQRDDANQDQIKAIMSKQLPRETRLTKADFILSNNGSLEDLKAEVQKLHQQLLEISST
ncbi:dephospho-CoA kinase [Pokkaliibacter sp. CJK22405]|uniref:dephospho-CoA kinase n=1 Tax=Pokkaliibacter sp. CJK22405 TaxID=3384615 RepID=UPI003984D06B